jgi:hypothetical protein
MRTPTDDDRRAALELLREADAILVEILDTALRQYGGGFGAGPRRSLLRADDPEVQYARERWNEAQQCFARALDRAGHDGKLRLADIDSMELGSGSVLDHDDTAVASDNVDRIRGFLRHVQEVFHELHGSVPDVAPLPNHEADDLAAAGDLAIAWHKRPLHLVLFVAVGLLFAVTFVRVTCG